MAISGKIEFPGAINGGGMKTVLNGPTMWPADGNHLVGPAPEWDTAPNFWLACAEWGSQVSLAPVR